MEYEKKVAAIMLIAETLNPLVLRGIVVALDELANQMDEEDNE